MSLDNSLVGSLPTKFVITDDGTTHPMTNMITDKPVNFEILLRKN